MVPDAQYRAIIMIDMLAGNRVMHLMKRGRHYYSIQEPKRNSRIRMNQQLMGLQYGYDCDRRCDAHAQNGGRNRQEKQIEKSIENCDSENSQPIQMLLRVMGLVKLPKDGIAVMKTMKPVSAEVVRHEQAKKLQPRRQGRDSLNS